jgi:hypothetical protein
MGLVQVVRTPITVENPLAVLAVGFLRLVIYLAGYGIAGALIGAAVGFGIDVTLGVW